MRSFPELQEFFAGNRRGLFCGESGSDILGPSLRDGRSTGRKQGVFCISIQTLNTDGTSEAPDAVIRLSTVVVDENSAVAKITEECSSEFSHFRRGFQPTRRLCVECSECLEFAILVFRQNFKFQWRQPCRWRCWLAYALFVTPVLHGHNRRFCGPAVFLANSQKMYSPDCLS